MRRRALASSRLARPSTAFCSCSTVGMPGEARGQHRSAPRRSRRSRRRPAAAGGAIRPRGLNEADAELHDALRAADDAGAGQPPALMR